MAVVSSACGPRPTAPPGADDPEMGMPTEWIVVIVVLVLLFGPKRLPDLAKSIGQSLREFKRATREAVDETDAEEEVATRPAEPQRRMETSEPELPSEQAEQQPRFTS